MSDITNLFAENGALTREISGFKPRAAQTQMAEAVADSITQAQTLVVEAGTGTGKTFAYLIPAMLADQKVIVSTGTKHLQDQLFDQDVPRLKRALATRTQIALLKGRANYLCSYRLKTILHRGRLESRKQVSDLHEIERWSLRTRSGDISEVLNVEEDSSLWGWLTSTTDSCLGQECPDIEECFVAAARKKALAADLVIVNHHLLCADLALKEDGFGELLPKADVYVVDEAHQLAETAGQFFSEIFSARLVFDLTRDAEAAKQSEAADETQLSERLTLLIQSLTDLRQAFGADNRRAALAEVILQTPIQAAFAQLNDQLKGVSETLALMAERGVALAQCAERAVALHQLFSSFHGMGQAVAHQENAHQENNSEHVSSEETVEEQCIWFETFNQSFSLHRTPLSIAAQFKQQMQRTGGSWIFTSATLAVGDDFTHFNRSLGLLPHKTLQLDSPFDYRRMSLMYHPDSLPDPTAATYNRNMVEQMLPVLQHSEGRAFFLFTSHSALKEAEELLTGRLDYPLLVQGSLPKAELLSRFRQMGNAVLLGTSSFWEGVDVRGEALSCVIIAKLPFASPGDPVEQARIEAIRLRGGNPFMQYQVPRAAIALKQGVGRLIRDVSDRGVLVLCDPRLTGKPYGKIFLDSLPPMTRTRQLERVARFFTWIKQTDQ